MAIIYDAHCILPCICSVQLRYGQPLHDLHPPSQLFERGCTVFASEVKALLIRDENKVISQELCALWDVVFLGSCFVGFAEFDDETVLDAEDCVGGLVGVVFEVEGTVAYQHSRDSLYVITGEESMDLRDQMVVTRLLEHEMHVCRSHGMSLQFQEQLAHRAVMRDWVGNRDNGVEPEDAIQVAAHDTSPVRSLAISMLDIIEAGRVGLPNVDLDTRDGFAVDIFDGTEGK